MKEREIGEIFMCDSKYLQVRESHDSTCKGCYFFDYGCQTDKKKLSAGFCYKPSRSDRKSVIFVEVSPIEVNGQITKKGGEE